MYSSFKLVLLCFAFLFAWTPVQAIKITVPKQYEEQVEALQKAEQAERERELKVTEEDQAITVGEAAVGGNTTANGERDSVPDLSDVDESDSEKGTTDLVSAGAVLAESLAEATNTAGAFAEEMPEGQGFVSGQIVDKETGQPVSGVAILIEGTEVGTITDSKGRYTLGPALAGEYTVNFVKSGYIEANVTEFSVEAGEVSVFPFALPPRPVEMSDEVYELSDFTVTADEANELTIALDMRMSSDKLLNIMTNEDFSKFASSDVGDAARRITGVNVVGGEFVIIRGLEERYSNTKLNNASVPSPDPDRQSVQVDLFSTKMLSSIDVAKSFSPDQSGNSAGGALTIRTSAYPEEVNFTEISVSAGASINTNAQEEFYEVSEGLASLTKKDGDVVGEDFSASISRKQDFKDVELRGLAVASVKTRYKSKDGIKSERFLSPQSFVILDRRGNTELTPGSLAYGQIPNASPDGEPSYIQSTYSEIDSYLASVGISFGAQKNHSVDALFFQVNKSEEVGESTFNFAPLINPYDPTNPSEANLGDSDNGIRVRRTAESEYYEQKASVRDRELSIKQIFGEHVFFPEHEYRTLGLNWIVSSAEASQEDFTREFNYWYEPSDVTFDGETSPSSYRVNFGQGGGNPLSEAANEVSEDSDYYALNLAHEGALFGTSGDVVYKLSLGMASDSAEREVTATSFERLVGEYSDPNDFTQSVDSPQELETNLLESSNYQGGVRNSTTVDATREIEATYIDAKVTFLDKIDFLFGLRREDIQIKTVNEPFIFLTQQDIDSGIPFTNLPDGRPVQVDSFRGFNSGVPQINPNVLLMFEQAGPGSLPPSENDGFPSGYPGVDNVELLTGEPGVQNITTVEELLDAINGEIDEQRFLPRFGVTFRPMDGFRLSLNYSKAYGLPSFRELGYYLSVSDGADEQVLGNPNLVISDANNYDVRVEYTQSDTGLLISASGFRKDIESPIEPIILTDPLSETKYQTFFNNSNGASIDGYEFEIKTNLGFNRVSWLENFSVGLNYTRIFSETKRSQAIIDLYSSYFADETKAPARASSVTVVGDPVLYGGMSEERRLFNQPESIANAFLTYDNPDWGLGATLSYYSISDVLVSVGSVGLNRSGDVTNATLDRYADAYDELTLTVSKSFWGGNLKFTAKNITDSERKIIYDRDSLGGEEVPERAYKVGVDYSISYSYDF